MYNHILREPHLVLGSMTSPWERLGCPLPLGGESKTVTPSWGGEEALWTLVSIRGDSVHSDLTETPLLLDKGLPWWLT